MTKIRTIIVRPFDGIVPLVRPWETATVEDILETWQAIVDGWIEHHPLPDWEGHQDGIFLNEEGKFRSDFEINHLVTYICRETLFPNDVIMGPVALIGPPDHEGANTEADIPFWLGVLEGIWVQHVRHSGERRPRDSDGGGND